MFDQNENEPDRRPKRPASRNPLVWIIVITLIIIFFAGALNLPNEKEKSLSYLWQKAEEGAVKTVTISNDSVTAELRSGVDSDSKIIVATSDKSLMEKHIDRCEELKADGRIEDYKVAGDSQLWPMILQWLFPLVIFFLLIYFLFIRQMRQGAGGGVLSFGKSRARLIDKERSPVTFEDVAGIDEAKAECVEVIEFLKNPEKFQRLGGRMPR